MLSGDTFCFNLSATDDSILEPTEQFELYFENLPTEFATVGDPSTLCITIEDMDGKLNPVHTVILMSICTCSYNIMDHLSFLFCL